MAGAEAIINFLKSRVGNLGVSSLILVTLEKMMDINFVCPCQPGLNRWIVAFYAIVPLIGCFCFTWHFVNLKPEDNVTGDKSTDKKKEDTGTKFLFSLLVALIWLFLYFFDGRYLACAYSCWEGEYTETSIMKWCKPIGNKTLVFKRQQETQASIVESQVSSKILIIVAKCFY